MKSAAATSSRSTWWGQALQNNLIALVLAMVVAVPLLASPADSRLAGAAVLAFEAFALLLAVTLLWRCRWNIGREQIVTFLRTGANTPVLLLLALAVVSCVFAPNKIFAVQETMKLGAGVLLYFVVAYQFRQSKHLLMLVDTLIFLAIAVSFLTMAQYTLGETALSGMRGTMLFGNQQPLGSLLMILLPVVAVIALTEKQLSKRQIGAQVATVMTAGGLLLAHTRSGWLGALAGLLVLAALLAYSAKAKKSDESRTAAPAAFASQKQKLVMPLMLAIVVIGFGVSLKMGNSGIFERAGSLTKASTDASFQERVQGWTGIVKMIEAKPLTGWGVGQYPIYQQAFTGAGASAAAITGFKTRGSLAEQAHNYYLQTAADLGLPGLVLFLAIPGMFLYLGVKRVGKMDDGIRRSLLIGSLGATSAFAVDAMSSPAWQYGQVSMFLWLMLGVGVGCMRPRPRKDEVTSVVTAPPALLRPVVLVAASVVFALVVMPSATLTAHAADGYNDGDDGNITELAIGASLALLLGSQLFNFGGGSEPPVVEGTQVGAFQPITVEGYVFEDLNGNGLREANESGLPGRTMFIDANNNGVLDAGEPSVVTNSAGAYSFRGLGQGNYRVRQAQRGGWTLTTPNPPAIAATSGTNVVNLNFGNVNTVAQP